MIKFKIEEIDEKTASIIIEGKESSIAAMLVEAMLSHEHVRNILYAAVTVHACAQNFPLDKHFKEAGEIMNKKNVNEKNNI